MKQKQQQPISQRWCITLMSLMACIGCLSQAAAYDQAPKSTACDQASQCSTQPVSKLPYPVRSRPELWDTVALDPLPDSLTQCQLYRAKKLSELPPPWDLAASAPIGFKCSDSGTSYRDSELGDLRLQLQLKIHPNSLSSFGFEVAHLREVTSDLFGETTMTLNVPYSEAKPVFLSQLRQYCGFSKQPASSRRLPCAKVEIRKWNKLESLYLRTNEISGIWVHAHPRKPDKTVVVVAWTD